MKELIKEILKDYVNLLLEGITFGKKFILSDGKVLVVFFNEHSLESVGVKSKLRRVDKDTILDSIDNIKRSIFNTAIIANKKKKSIIVNDFTMDDIDYHLYIKKISPKEGEPDLVEVIVNTSIYHPLKLPIKPQNSVIKKNWDSPAKIIESKNYLKIII